MGIYSFLADALMVGYIMPVAAGIIALAAHNNVMPLNLMFFYTPDQAFAMIEKYDTVRQDARSTQELSLRPILSLQSFIHYFSACSFHGCSGGDSNRIAKCKNGMRCWLLVDSSIC
jgi:hypothetical protein